jgi:hypothetical protein
MPTCYEMCASPRDEPGHDGVGTAQVAGQGRWYNAPEFLTRRFSEVLERIDEGSGRDECPRLGHRPVGIEVSACRFQ